MTSAARPKRSDRTRRSGTIFVLSQLVIIPAILFAAWFLVSKVNDRPLVPPLNEYPRTIEPEYNMPMVVSDDQLQEVLLKLRPRFSPDQPPKTNFVDHALRFWGVEVEFYDDSLDGSDLRELLTDHREFLKVWGEHEPPLLADNKYGISVRTQEGRSTVSHVDHLLGSLAEVGTPLSYEIHTPGGKGELIDLYRQALMSFSLNQKEYEWTTVALAFYAASNRSWYSPEGQELNFDRLARRIMREQQPQGVCYGQHRLYTLTMLLRIDSQMRDSDQALAANGLISQATRKLILEYLTDITRRAMSTHSVEGYWDGNWADDSIPVADVTTDPLSRRVLATGHMLEWWAMAPKELHPPRETIVRAGQWLTRVIIEMEPERIQSNYTFLTHAGRALSLWRGGFAGDLSKSDLTNTTDNHFLPFER